MAKKEPIENNDAKVGKADDNVNAMRSAEAENLIKTYVIGSVAVGALPVPLIDLAAISGLQLRMIQKICQLYGHKFSEQVVGSILTSLAGGVLATTVGLSIASTAKFIPGFGWALSMLSMPAVSGAATYAAGKVFVKHFEEGGTPLDLNASKFKEFYNQQFKKGKSVVTEAVKAAPQADVTDENAATG